MAVYFISAGGDPDELLELENRIRVEIPDLRRIHGIEELTQGLRSLPGAETGERPIVLFPLPRKQPQVFDRLLDITARHRDHLLFILISDEISAADYKRLARTGGADWVSTAGAPQEIRDILRPRHVAASEPTGRGKPAIVAFVPSGGGVGAATLSVEVAVQIKINKETRGRKLCLVDLDFQNSHVCDLLDIEPRLNIEELAAHPERLDAHLFEQFISHHSSGLHVLAAPRNKRNTAEANIAALDVLFDEMSQRYELLIVVLPVSWFSWTSQILGVADLAIVVGLNNIPSLRQAAATLQAIRSQDQHASAIVVALNRCESKLLGGVVEGQFAKRIIGGEKIHYIRDDAATAQHCANTGVPVSLHEPSSGIAKDVAALMQLVAALKPRQAAVRR